MTSFPKGLRALAFDDVTVSTSAVPATPNAILTATGTGNNSTFTACAAVITCNTNAIRLTVNGTTPTAALGHRLAPGDPAFVVYGTANLRNLKMIRESADSNVSITYFG